MDRQTTRSRIKGVNVCGDSLRSFRIMRGLTQVELARRAGYSDRLVRKAEAGGSLSLATVEDLADALSTSNKLVTCSDLCTTPVSLARNFVNCYDEHEQLMLNYCGNLLADEFVFHCAGAPDSLLAGEWLGVEGFQAWLNQLFSIVTRPKRKCLDVSYMISEDRVTAHYCDTFLAGDQSQHVMWVNLHFTTCHGVIVRIDDECDTRLASMLESGGSCQGV